MTSKTFNSESRRSMSMEIHQCDGTIPDEYIVQFMDGDHVLKSFYYKKSDAPAQALAILEAAGFNAQFHATGTYQDGDCWQLENVAQIIKDYLSIKDAEDAEAREQAELEAEAWNTGYEDGAVHAVAVRSHLDGLTEHASKRPRNPYRKEAL